MAAPEIDDDTLAAAAAVVALHGWHELTLERVADQAGLSRVTLYRRGVTRDTLLAALSARAARGWQAALWPAVTGSAPAADRLRAALFASCAAVELHLPLLTGLGAASDSLFRADATGPDVTAATPTAPAPAVPMPPLAGDAATRAESTAIYVAPFERILRDGIADGTLALTGDPALTASALFGMVPQTYLALRSDERWDADRAATALIELLLGGLLPR